MATATGDGHGGAALAGAAALAVPSTVMAMGAAVIKRMKKHSPPAMALCSSHEGTRQPLQALIGTPADELQNE
jgi:hypothetical protein